MEKCKENRINTKPKCVKFVFVWSN